MADQELVEILKQGVEVWNKWRSEHPKDVLDFSKVDLSGANLHEADPIGVILRGSDLSGTSLIGANLQGADLRNANMSEAILIEARIYRGELDAVILKGADIRDLEIMQDAGI